MSCGVVKFMPREAFFDSWDSLDAEDLADLVTGTPKSPTTSGWPKITHAIFHSSEKVFVIETITPSFSALLRFSSDDPKAGHYEIREFKKSTEIGRTVTVVPVKADAKDRKVAMLAPFKLGFAIRTRRDAAPNPERIWLIGLMEWKDDGATDHAGSDQLPSHDGPT